MKELKQIILKNMKRQHFDSIAVGVIDFSSRTFKSLDLGHPEGMYYDLASLTKPLTLASTFHHSPELFDNEMLLLLNHRGGLPSWGRLSGGSWKETILGYSIKESATVYSDYSALRLMLELEKKSGKKIEQLTSDYWDSEVMLWLNLPDGAVCPFTGFREGDSICGEVHDDKAYVIGEFTTHAGLFGTINGVCKSLLKLEEQTKFIGDMEKRLPCEDRYCCGWDTVENPENTLAGAGCSPKTFGHLGFTGTSIWIDPEKRLGHVILSNATQNYWYDRDGISELRRIIGQWVWTKC